MSEWIWLAGWGRLKHLALMRASAASRRFARLNAFAIVTGLAIFQATQYGWRWVTNSPALDPRFEPGGPGWLHVASAPRPIALNLAPEIPVNLWWNPIQSAVALVAGLVAGLILIWLALVLIRLGATCAHTPPYRNERRMTAAIHYSTAWGILIFAATLLMGLRPIAYIGAMERWSWYPPRQGFELAAAVVAGFGLVLWWFWLLRLGTTAPAPTRRPVVAFFAVGTPVIVCAVAAGWYFGLDRLYEPVFEVLGVTF